IPLRRSWAYWRKASPVSTCLPITDSCILFLSSAFESLRRARLFSSGRTILCPLWEGHFPKPPAKGGPMSPLNIELAPPSCKEENLSQRKPPDAIWRHSEHGRFLFNGVAHHGFKVALQLHLLPGTTLLSGAAPSAPACRICGAALKRESSWRPCISRRCGAQSPSPREQARKRWRHHSSPFPLPRSGSAP